jgi:hypothetical protein
MNGLAGHRPPGRYKVALPIGSTRHVALRQKVCLTVPTFVKNQRSSCLFRCIPTPQLVSQFLKLPDVNHARLLVNSNGVKPPRLRR